MSLIVQLANFYGPSSGGLRTALDELGRGYAAAGIDRVLIVPGPDDDEVHGISGVRLTLRSPVLPGSGGYRLIASARRVLDVLDSLRPDAVEVSDKLTLVAAGRWGGRRGVSAILLSHERIDATLADRVPRFVPLGAAADLWNRRLAAAFDTVVCPSRFTLDEFERIGARNTALVPWGVDHGTFRPDAAQTGNDRTDGARLELVCVGRLSREKRPEIAIDTAAELTARGLDVHLTMIGDGPLRRHLQQLASTRRSKVTFTGHLDERNSVAALLAGADVTIAPCPVEAFGLSILESLACGTPVVTSATGAGVEVTDIACGRAAAGGAQTFADAVEDLIGRDRSTLQQRARRRAEQFTWSAAARELVALHGLRGRERSVQSGRSLVPHNVVPDRSA